jgi:hypothetical protein
MKNQIIRNFDEFLNEEEEFVLDQEMDQDVDIYDELDEELEEEFEYDELDEEYDYEDEYESEDEYTSEEDYELDESFDFYYGEEDEEISENKKLMGKAKKMDPKAAAMVKTYKARVAGQILMAKTPQEVKAILQQPIPGNVGPQFAGKKNQSLLPGMAAQFNQLTAQTFKGKLDIGAFKKMGLGLAGLQRGIFKGAIKKGVKGYAGAVKGAFKGAKGKKGLGKMIKGAVKGGIKGGKAGLA